MKKYTIRDRISLASLLACNATHVVVGMPSLEPHPILYVGEGLKRTELSKTWMSSKSLKPLTVAMIVQPKEYTVDDIQDALDNFTDTTVAPAKNLVSCAIRNLPADYRQIVQDRFKLLGIHGGADFRDDPNTLPPCFRVIDTSGPLNLKQMAKLRLANMLLPVPSFVAVQIDPEPSAGRTVVNMLQFYMNKPMDVLDSYVEMLNDVLDPSGPFRFLFRRLGGGELEQLPALHNLARSAAPPDAPNQRTYTVATIPADSTYDALDEQIAWAERHRNDNACTQAMWNL